MLTMSSSEVPSSVPIKNQNDLVVVRQATRSYTLKLKLGIVDQTKVITAASELARNTPPAVEWAWALAVQNAWLMILKLNLVSMKARESL